jgi:2'-5' RNA ligase
VRSDARIRAFFAVDLDEAARAAAREVLRALREGPGGDAVRWVRAEALHVTLRFLGDIDPGRVKPLARAVGHELAGLGRFEMTLGAARVFPSPRRPRVVALEVGPEERLAELAAGIERGVVEAGFEPEERRFRAHLTLGRTKGSRPPATRGLAVPDGTACEVEEVVLFRSELQRSGARYTPLERAPLSGPSHHP